MKSNKNYKPKTDKRTRAIRIIAWILILMTFATTIYTALYFIIDAVRAADNGGDDISIAVGILYGSDVDVGLTATTTNGFTVGSETIETYTKTFTELWSLPDYKKVTVLCDKNYELVGTSYKVTSSPNIGAYRLDTGATYKTADELRTAVKNTDAKLAGSDYYSIPAYINGAYKLYIGSFLTESAASNAVSAVKKLLPSANITVKKPSSTGTFAVEHGTKNVLFMYDCGNNSYLAFDAINNKDGSEAYLTTYNNNLYDGVFVFKRTTSGSKEGITLMTVVPLEQYVMGVIPYEISSSWPLETQRVFAILARTFVINGMKKHYSQYGFNVCATSNCQVYRGVARVNATVREAVTSTAGLVTTYNGKLAAMYYCSSTGDCTADVEKVWGSKIEWLSGVQTPWEDYQNHSNAFWTAEVSPTELREYLNANGYTTLKGEIKSITINETAGDASTYVCGVTVTDSYGTSVKITRCDKVRAAFSKYVNSANFVVGKGSVDYTVYTETVPPTSGSATSNGIFSVLTSKGTQSVDMRSSAKVLTGSGQKTYTPGGSVAVQTAGGKVNVSTDGSGSGSTSSNIVTKTLKAEKSGNFVFVGKGWGHGVGISQWGLYDLAKMGVDWLDMINAYCPGVSVGDYKKLIKY